jgi:hypothetical protein
VTRNLSKQALRRKLHRRFADFCDACRRYRYIGLCYGVHGVGKTLSARTTLIWALVEPLVFPCAAYVGTVPSAVGECRTPFYTPAVVNSPARIASELERLRNLNWVLGVAQTEPGHAPTAAPNDQTELVVIDEADRLKMAGLKQVRDLNDQNQWGLVLLGMPGLERRLSRYPQLYSRVGFVHQFRTLSADEIRAVVTGHAEQLGVLLGPEVFADPLAVAAVALALPLAGVAILAGVVGYSAGRGTVEAWREGWGPLAVAAELGKGDVAAACARTLFMARPPNARPPHEVRAFIGVLSDAGLMNAA